ncbi:MAG: hypothetical protein QMD85_00345 [Candidatus Aenigmarchaeota archaeon]|nr:hypothetical protein [Candidatus Aenigmarchaeota archaeon]MDI6721966.1 hypothetical protein [Candidatus Aenigmarchaeota archaeon]
MPYKVGISSGFWNIAKDPNLLGLAQKAGGFGATGGIQFNQVDMETISEFNEPRLKENMKKIVRDLGIEVGLHGEIGEMSGFESAIRKTWEQTHLRLVQTLKNAAELGFIYVNYHLSANLQVQQEEDRLKAFGHQYQVVSPQGTPFADYIADKRETKAFAVRYIIAPGYSVDEEIREKYKKILEDQARKEVNDEVEKFKNSDHYKKMKQAYDAGIEAGRFTREDANAELAREVERYRAEIERRKMNEIYEKLGLTREGSADPDLLFRMWGESLFGKYFMNFGEIGAYWLVARYMIETGDTLWNSVVKTSVVQDAYNSHVKEFNEAVSMKYIEGHLTIDYHPFNKQFLGGMSVLQFAEKNNIKLLFENPEAGQGREGLYRLYDLRSAYHLMRKINSPSLRFCVDFEHMMAQNQNPEQIVKDLPGDFGKYVFLFHLGEPKPYFGTAHIPIPLGSQAQEVLYRWIHALRRKGFSSGYLIFERGGGRAGSSRSSFEVFEHSVWVLRQIAKYLEQDVPPQELPPEFFGIAEQNKEVYARELVTIREHAFDPLKDVFIIPEEEHTFLGRSAVEKGKTEQWGRRKYR